MLIKLCPQCKKKLCPNEHCSCSSRRHKFYNAQRRDQEKNAFYQSRDWKLIAAQIKARASGLDEFALAQGRLEKGNTAHHIFTIDESPELRLSVDNLIYVSTRTHNQIHSEYSRSPEQKDRMQKKLSEIVRNKGSGH